MQLHIGVVYAKSIIIFLFLIFSSFIIYTKPFSSSQADVYVVKEIAVYNVNNIDYRPAPPPSKY